MAKGKVNLSTEGCEKLYASVASGLTQYDISGETWREYEWMDPVTGNMRLYRVESPVTLYLRPGGSTHRVVDVNGVVHCVPDVGRFGCVLRWQKPPGTNPVDF